MANPNQFNGSPNIVSWRIWSTAESVRNREPSVMAIAETCFAPIFYLWLTFHVGWLLPLYVAAAIAPFVLLRSDKSVALGIKWALHWDIDVARKPSSIWLSVFCVVALACYWFLAIAFWSALFPGHAIQSAAALGAIIFAPILLVLFSIFLLAITIRIVATAVFWREGLQSLPENFRVLIFCVSPSQVPELIPGLDDATSILSFSGFRKFFALIELSAANDFEASVEWLVSRFNNLTGIDLNKLGRSVSKLVTPRPILRAVRVGMYIISALFVFAPAWAYRFTIKSTIWFWWPLAFIGGDLRLAGKPDLLRWNLIGSLWAKTSILIACLSLLAFIWTNAFLDGTIFQENPLITPIGYFLLLDWRLQPWQACAILASAMSVVLVFWMNDIAGRFRIAKKTNDTALQTRVMIELGWMERFARLRFLFVLSFWFLVVVHGLLYLNSRMCTVHLSDNVQRLAQTVYGNRTPKITCIGATMER